MKYQSYPLSRKGTVITGCVACAVLIAGCGSSTKSSTPTTAKTASAPSPKSTTPAAVAPGVIIDGVTVKVNPALRAALPSRYRQSGHFVYVTNAIGPPRTELSASGQVVGAVPDLLKAVAATWGVHAIVQKASFDAEIPGVQSGRYDIAADTGDFASQDVINFVDFMVAGAAFVVAAGNPKHVTGLNTSLCGLSVTVTGGTTQETQLQNLAPKCKAAGKSAVKVLSLAQGSLEVPITAGRADAAFDNTSTAALLVQQEPSQFALGGPLLIEANLAFGVNKSNTAFFNDLRQTTQTLVDDGTYNAIMTKWGQTKLELKRIVTNTHAAFP